MAAGRLGARRLAPLAALAALAGCIQDDGSRFNPLKQFSPEIDTEGERELGWEFDRALQEAITVIHDPMVAGFLIDLGQSIVSEIEPQPFVYRFRVVEDPRLNAFAVPGGFVYFHSGTIMAAGSVDELAGVMGHEIAHVKARHYARMRKQSAIPDLATQIVGLSAAIAAKEPALMIIAQGINVSMQLRYSREAEAEADQLGSIWMSRAGFEPSGIVRFFERILEEQRRHPSEMPPYLYSHPAVDERIEAIQIQSEDLRPLRPRDPAWNERLGRVQARLALLIDAGRETLTEPAPPADTSKTDPLLAEAEERAREGRIDAALLTLARAEAAEPADPRVPYRIGELLQAAGRDAEAVPAFRRTLRLDPSRALVFFKLGRSYAAIGDRHRAVFSFEQAALRAGSSGDLRIRALFEVEKLTFPVAPEAGFAAPGGSREMPPPPREVFDADEGRVLWWARLGPHFVPHVARFQLRWVDPGGAAQREQALSLYRGPFVVSLLEGDGALEPGTWTAELRLDGDLIRSDRVAVRP